MGGLIVLGALTRANQSSPGGSRDPFGGVGPPWGILLVCFMGLALTLFEEFSVMHKYIYIYREREM